ncbi:hypothetical protein RJ639_043550 [Escallonia herrerae]|uniref:RNase H type-1 domain-containing protein n=1 Tax=Escallonia herrerae TaxID=1293975 RepID=A0AA89B019_9ASTE|nr:hypothetical protein RJ639_043550 [Escallonia herrerae]
MKGHCYLLALTLYERVKSFHHVKTSFVGSNDNLRASKTSSNGESFKYIGKRFASIVAKNSKSISKQASNNEAEYEALLAGIRLAHSLRVDSLSVHSDSQLVINHILGEYEARDERMVQKLEVSDPKAVIGKLWPNWEGPYRISKVLGVQEPKQRRRRQGKFFQKLDYAFFGHLIPLLIHERKKERRKIDSWMADAMELHRYVDDLVHKTSAIVSSIQPYAQHRKEAELLIQPPQYAGTAKTN